MNVIAVSADFFKCNVVAFLDLLGDIQNCSANMRLQESFSVFDRKDEVIVGVVCTVVGVYDAHAGSIPENRTFSDFRLRNPPQGAGYGFANQGQNGFHTLGELWDFTASAVGGKGFGENQSAILASAKSLHISNSEQVTTSVSIVPNSHLFPKQSEVMTSHAPRAWWLETESYAPRKPHALASTPATPKEKTLPCISDLAGVKFLLKKERVFFFRGSALQVFGQCVGLQCGLGKAKIFFLGERIFRFASTDFPPAGGVWGGMRAGFGLGVFGNSAATINKHYQIGNNYIDRYS